MRAALFAVAMFVLAACSPVCGTSSTSSPGNGCGHPGFCLTLTGPLAGATSGLVQAPDCIPGAGLDVDFTTHIGSHETTIEILVTDNSAKSTPGFRAGTFLIKSSRGAPKSLAFASIYIKPDTDVAGYAGGWSTDASGSSGTVSIDGNESGQVHDAVVAPTKGSGTPLHVSGTFNCR